MIKTFLQDFSLSALSAAIVATLVAYSGPIAIIFQAAQAGGLSNAELASWLWAMSIGGGLSGIVLSLRFRLPIMAAWNSAGAAALVTSLGIYSFAEAIGAYIISALLIIALGFSARFQALILRIPRALASAMLAGVLFQFVLQAVDASIALPILGAPMVVIFFVARVLIPKYALLLVMGYGVFASFLMGGFHGQGLGFGLAMPILTMPEWSLRALLGIALPLFILAMSSQNIPGVAVLEASGYENPPLQSILKTTGLFSLLGAPFGSHGVNLGAITAAIMTGPDANPDPQKRYVATVFCGLFYGLVGLFGASVVELLQAFPAEFIALLAGLALFGAVLAGLQTAMASPHADAALVVFVVTASGVVVAGIGSAFWGIVAGLLVLAVRKFAQRNTP